MGGRDAGPRIGSAANPQSFREGAEVCGPGFPACYKAILVPAGWKVSSTNPRNAWFWDSFRALVPPLGTKRPSWDGDECVTDFMKQSAKKPEVAGEENHVAGHTSASSYAV